MAQIAAVTLDVLLEAQVEDLWTDCDALCAWGASQAPPCPVRVKPHAYQPSKAELEEDVKIDATPEKLAEAVLRPVKIVEDPDA